VITKPELIRWAKKLSLSPQIIEKDYVLGWVLAGISTHPILKESWIFKGGTCLKKCYFKEYRFSEDLDFTVIKSSEFSITDLLEIFKTISVWIYENSGIQIPEADIKFEVYENKRNSFSCQGKFAYLGPLAPTSPKQWPRIKLDLTSDEVLITPPIRLEVHHPYSDCPDSRIQILSYGYVEIFSEKLRALAERTRPRDLYDVVHLFELHQPPEIQAFLVETLKKKCDFKKITPPTIDSLEAQKQLCKGGWEDQLSHQIHDLQKFEAYWNQLEKIFDSLTS
jgi:predicted nucleotidyltransferase component of viral defense system